MISYLNILLIFLQSIFPIINFIHLYKTGSKCKEFPWSNNYSDV